MQNKEEDCNLTIIIPTYRERDNLEPLIESIHTVIRNHNYRILVVDDNSQDGTAELIQSLKERYPVEIVVRLNERGLASAVVHGIRLTSTEIYAVMDADMQHPPEILPLLKQAIFNNGAEIAIASRYIYGGSCEGWSLIRRIMSRGATFLSHLLLPRTRQIKDPMSGYFMFRSSVINGVRLDPKGFKILLELLVKGNYRKVIEVPYTFKLREKGKSKLKLKQQVDYLTHLLKLMWSAGEFSRFFKYCLVGASGVVVDEGVFWLLTSFGRLFNVLSAAISAEVAIISNFTLNNYFTFSDRRLGGTGVFVTRLLKFNLVSLFGIGIKLGVFWVLTLIFGVHDLWFNLCGIAVATVWNYLVNTWWTWK